LTVAGDASQQVDPWACFESWPVTLRNLGREAYETVELTTSYRCTKPIAEFGRAVLGPLAPPNPMRAPKPGVPVAVTTFANEGHLGIFLSEALSDLESREPDANVAVIAHRASTARRLREVIGRAVSARLVLDGEFPFHPGIDVTEVTQVKGLEFDYVIVPDATTSEYPDTPEARRVLHVAVTRAIHQLWIIAAGALSPVVEQARSELSIATSEPSADQP
jgi:DNA helicase IV